MPPVLCHVSPAVNACLPCSASVTTETTLDQWRLKCVGLPPGCTALWARDTAPPSSQLGPPTRARPGPRTPRAHPSFEPRSSLAGHQDLTALLQIPFLAH